MLQVNKTWHTIPIRLSKNIYKECTRVKTTKLSFNTYLQHSTMVHQRLDTSLDRSIIYIPMPMCIAVSNSSSCPAWHVKSFAPAVFPSQFSSHKSKEQKLTVWWLWGAYLYMLLHKSHPKDFRHHLHFKTWNKKRKICFGKGQRGNVQSIILCKHSTRLNFFMKLPPTFHKGI